LYNKLVASYHKAKTERSSLAHQLEVAQGKSFCFVRLADVFFCLTCRLMPFCRLAAAAA
jgi:hypothetical protein